jgi:hypothetical protein
MRFRTLTRTPHDPELRIEPIWFAIQFDRTALQLRAYAPAGPREAQPEDKLHARAVTMFSGSIA